MGSWNAINRAGSVMGHEWSDLVCGVLSDGYWTLEQGTEATKNVSPLGCSWEVSRINL